MGLTLMKRILNILGKYVNFPISHPTNWNSFESVEDRVPDVPTDYFADPARLKTITFHYALDSPLEKAAQLATDFSIMDCETLIIVETDQESYLGEHAVTNTLALLSSFSRDCRRSIVCLPHDENLIMIATLFTKHIYVAGENGTLSSLNDFAHDVH
ncbi:hypothetical protein OESDEN_06450 [Oesophagostomum dentatum]|uniref:Uncharacterized protein n=1 Tax=Oesophagostomum dentatum TaxID=61180 RepID=A0A0B1TE70_OESDE|nr:hypothetical protein OESDEN_06450 [Oesophagostomum dentatum]